MSFPFEKCYDPKELEGYGITVNLDSLGNTSFLYKKVEIGYLLDIPGEGFEIATSFTNGRLDLPGPTQEAA